MAMQKSDLILSASRGSAEHAIASLDGPDQTDRAYVHGVYRWAEATGVDASIVIAQAFHETARLTSTRWLRDRNPAGIGIPADHTAQPFTIADGDAAARLHIQCLYSLVTHELHPDVPLWPAALSWLRSIWIGQKLSDPAHPHVRRIDDLNIRYIDQFGEPQATWAWDAAYADKFIRFGNAIFGGSLATSTGGTIMSTLLPAPPVEISITPLNNVNRPKLEMPSPHWITVHEVGNTTPGADENMHRAFVHNGGGEANVSFHFVVGPTKVIQLIPLDEATWHASDGFNGTGNRNSVAIETIQIGDFDRSLHHLAWLVAELVRNPGRFMSNRKRDFSFSPERIVQHNHWAPDNKNCPEFMRDRGLWPELLNRVSRELRIRGGAVEPFAPALLPDFLQPEELERGIDRQIEETTFFAMRRTWLVARETKRLQHTGAGAPEIGPTIEPGETFVGEFVFRSHGEWWVLTRFGSRVRMADLAPQIELLAS
jgi:N-acetylmuramoyl-L-alanine amidase